MLNLGDGWGWWVLFSVIWSAAMLAAFIWAVPAATIARYGRGSARRRA